MRGATGSYRGREVGKKREGNGRKEGEWEKNGTGTGRRVWGVKGNGARDKRDRNRLPRGGKLGAPISTPLPLHPYIDIHTNSSVSILQRLIKNISRAFSCKDWEGGDYKRITASHIRGENFVTCFTDTSEISMPDSIIAVLVFFRKHVLFQSH